MDTATTAERPPSAVRSEAWPRWSPVELLPALLIAVLGVVLLAPGHALWFDELFTAEVARLPLADILAAITSGEGTTSYLDGVQNPPDLHLTGREAGEIATKAGVGRLLLTHLVTAWGSESETHESAASTFAGPVEIVRPGARYEV